MKKRFVFSILIGFAITGIVLVCNGYRHTDASTQSVTTEIEVELITLRPAGFEPSEITRPKGPFVLVIDDRSGKDVSSIRLQKVQGERLRDVNTNRGKSEWHDLVDLPPGDYVLTDSSNSAAQCQIIILP